MAMQYLEKASEASYHGFRFFVGRTYSELSSLFANFLPGVHLKALTNMY
jgi:hypothetical protein